ncbi:hypothetical protein PRIPAC_73155 [Pristionchus pacificus]|uniref:Uncharacterized protein n=1 Tax=Pristionchus pacificus TaxID=54126 RepID=A0A2A6C1D4_PRIPA|nr:hypothetical protein PRIPAC_73155 [Pristionchus pacificus]|eukprot:PDM71841.1 hypothetical protein PRIPAC_38248 [Pristionchus pacificus]
MAKMSTSRIVTLVLTGGQILFCIILIGLAFAVPKAYPGLAASCIVNGFFGLFIPIMGFCGILCKNTCLMMVYIVCCIIDMIELATNTLLCILVAAALGTAEGKEEFMKEQYECAAKELLAGRTVTKDDFGTPKQCAGLFWGAAVICFISLVWMGANTHFYFKARKEVKAEEMHGAFGGGGAPGYPPPAYPPAPGYGYSPAPGNGYPPPGSFPPSTPSQPSQPSMPSR